MRNMTMLILSCDKYSDLWEGHLKLLEENWSDRGMKTIIVTDSPSDKEFPGIEIFSAGTETEWSKRLALALEEVDTEYVFLTLDDYFLIKKVSNQSIDELISMMDEEQIDYVRLFRRPKRASKGLVKNYKNVFWIDLKCKYSVNLYAGIWKKKFLTSMVKTPMNAWNFEVSLSKSAQAYGAKCAVSYRNEFEILDVVRKGKLLHKSAAYFKKHPCIYDGNRPVNTWAYEIKLNIQILGSRILPLWTHKYIKSILRKCGRTFFNEDD